MSLNFLKWVTPKEGVIFLWKEGCCVIGCCNQHLLSPTNLLSRDRGTLYHIPAAPVLCGLVLGEEVMWVWEPPATCLVCRQDDVVLLGIESVA